MGALIAPCPQNSTFHDSKNKRSVSRVICDAEHEYLAPEKAYRARVSNSSTFVYPFRRVCAQYFDPLSHQ